MYCGERLGLAPPLRSSNRELALPIGGGEAEEIAQAEEAEMTPRRALAKTGIGGVWIVLALFATCYRLCTG